MSDRFSVDYNVDETKQALFTILKKVERQNDKTLIFYIHIERENDKNPINRFSSRITKAIISVNTRGYLQQWENRMEKTFFTKFD